MKQDRLERLKENACHYIRYYQPEEVAAYVKEKCPEEAGEEIRQAKLLMDQTFVFRDEWDMEPCATPYQLTPMVWDYAPNGDPEWIYMLNRQEYLKKLLHAFYMEGEDQYLNKLKEYLFGWIKQNPASKWGGVTTRTIDTGIRCMAWNELIIHLAALGCVTDEELLALIESVREQIQYLKQNYIGKYSLSNWGVLQATAICQSFLWFADFLEDEELKAWARAELKTQIDLQVLDDGSHWEQSIMYHMEVLNACMKLMVSDRWFQTETDQMVSEKLHAMSHYVLHAAGPDGRQLPQGDSDISDVRDVLVKAAVLWGDGQLKSQAFSFMDADSAWLLGREGILRYQNLEKLTPAQNCRNFEDTGNIYLRSGWDLKASFTYLSNGPMGSSHGHIDLTHICLSYKGKPFLTDCGRYSYVEEEPLRPLLKSAYSHNVCVIDDDPHGTPVRAWEYEGYGDCLKNYVRSQDEIHYVEMAYTGKLKSGTFYLAVRKVLVIDPGLWMIVNDLRCDGVHKSREYYHLSPLVKAKRETGGYSLKEGEDELKLWGNGAWEDTLAPLSETYNQISNHTCLVKTQANWKDRMTDLTCLCADGIQVTKAEIKQYGSDRELEESMLTAREIWIRGELAYVVCVFHRENYRGGKVFFYQGIPIYGKTVVLKKTDEGFDRIRLRN